jgi:purine nucleosidase
VTKVVFDTDIGSDIDDAVALAYLLAHPECELLGITTVTGDVAQRAMLASAICKTVDRNIPIFPGAPDPLLIEQKQPLVPQAKKLGNWEHDKSFPSGEAVEFLRRTIRANPHEIILLATGPLTNIALLFRTDPEVASLLRGFVMMGGSVPVPDNDEIRLEWNIICDPHAAHIVCQTDIAIHRSIGLQVTTLVRMKAQEVRERFQAKVLQPVVDFAEVWFDETGREITFHDPLAATTIFQSDICQFEKGNVSVDLSATALLGLTNWKPGESPAKHEVAIAVNPDRFFEHYFGTVR